MIKKKIRVLFFDFFFGVFEEDKQILDKYIRHSKNKDINRGRWNGFMINFC